MLPDLPLFWFDIEVVYFCNRFWLVEYCCWFNGDRNIMEMVEIEGGLDGYVED